MWPVGFKFSFGKEILVKNNLNLLKYGMYYQVLIKCELVNSSLFTVTLRNCQIDEKTAVRRMRNSGRRSREDKRSNSKGNATDDDDDEEEEEGEDDEDVAVCAEGTSSGTISVVEAIVKQKVLDEVCSANVFLFCLNSEFKLPS